VSDPIGDSIGDSVGDSGASDDASDDADESAPHGVRWTAFRGLGFWSRDGLLQIWLALLVDDLDDPPSSSTAWLQALCDDWRLLASIRFNGLIESQLDDHIDDEPKRREAIVFCRRVRARIAEQTSHGASWGGPLARQVGGSRLGREDTQRGLLRTADAFLWLLERGEV
jgi:hypothetical protein